MKGRVGLHYLCGVQILSICLAATWVFNPAYVFAGEVEAFRSHQSQSLQAVKEKYDKIKKQYPNNAELEKFDHRIEIIDTLAVQIIKQYESVKSQAMQNVISLDVAFPAPAKKKVKSVSAADLIAQYQEEFSQPLPVPDIESSQLPVLKDYYDKSIQSAMDFITPRGCSTAIVNKAAATDTLSLAMVIHFLHISDKNWNKAYIERLPDLMKKSSTLEILEEVSFQVLRPRTAYQFFLYRINQDGENFDPDYFLMNSKRLLGKTDYIRAIRCLTVGLEIAGEMGCSDQSVPLAVELVNIYYNMGHLSLAIETLDEVLSKGPQHSDYCQAATLQLKYLYEDGRYKEVSTKSYSYLEGGDCQDYHPEIMYIYWLAARRDNQKDSADVIKEKFVRKYPQHALGANMLFDSAIDALANTNYAKSREILEQIEYHYPNSRIIPKVRDLKERLNKVE